MKSLGIGIVLAALLVSGCDLQSQHLARQGGDPTGGTDVSPSPTLDPHAVQPGAATNPVSGTVGATHPVQRLTVSAYTNPIGSTSGSPARSISVTFDTTDPVYRNQLYNAYVNGQRADFTFSLNMPTAAKTANYTFRLTSALVSQLTTSSATLITSTWSWDYQPVDSSGNPSGATQHGSN